MQYIQRETTRDDSTAYIVFFQMLSDYALKFEERFPPLI